MENERNDDRRHFIRGIVVGAVITLVLVEVALYAEDFITSLSAKSTSETTAETDDAAEEEGTGLDLTSDEIIAKLEEIEAIIDAYYLNDVDTELVESYIYKGVVAGLDDAYSAYYTEDEYASLMDSTNGSYCGIGVSITQSTSTGIITVYQVFEDSPAEEAGLLEGDILYKVEDWEVTGEDLNSVVAEIKGEEGTTVNITIVREGEDDYIELTVERHTIEVETVEYEMLDDDIGYIYISSFDDVTVDQFNEALDDLEGQGMESLIIDLRDNGGGLVSSVCSILDEILPEGLIVYTEDKYGNREEEYSDAENYLDIPLVVLVNENSASASEIFAGAIKDYGIGTLVGTTTYGKGIVQNIYTLSDGTGLKITVSKYYTPNGNNIHEVGIEPDVEVEYDSTAEEDNQLAAAVEILTE